MVPWQAIPITAFVSAWVSVLVALTAYAIVKVGADSDIDRHEGGGRE